MELAPLIIGLCALYIPTFINFSQSRWQTDDEGHGPLILMAALWMFYELSRNMKVASARAAPLSGGLSLLAGLLTHIVSHSQGIAILEVASMIPTIGGALAATYGWSTVNALRFPLFFLIFMAPVPGFIIDALTGPLKLFISTQAESIMYALGYPVARVGVSLSVGQYQLLVADACAGLNSMFTLEALGLLYMNVVRHESVFRNAMLAILIVPISYCSNVIRILILA